MKQPTFREVSLDTLGGGAAVELFNQELQKVIENIRDPNTEAEQKRTITLKTTIKPREDRDQAAVLVEATSSLAPHKPHGVLIHIGRESRDADLVAVEQDQRDIFDSDEDHEGDGGVVPLDRKEATK